MIVTTLTLPAHWAVYLLYGDATPYDLSDEDIRLADEIAGQYGYCTGYTGEPEFTSSWEFDYPGAVSGDALTYTFVLSSRGN